MLEDGQELKRNGIDVVIGYFEPHARPDTTEKTIGLERVALHHIEYRGSSFEEMDADAIVERHPGVALVDEYPHTNVPGSLRGKRWEDVELLLTNGIDVYTTMNVQHLESLNDQVRQISGIQVRETVPDWVVQQAAEVVMVDVTPRALLKRMERGVVYTPEKARTAMENFFREPTLRALRELAMRQTAHEVDIRADSGHSSESILILVTEDPASAALIRRAKRVADYLKASCFAVAIRPREPVATGLEKHLNFARDLHIETRILENDEDDQAKALAEFARANAITQIFLSWPKQVGRAFRPSLVQRIIREAKDLEITIVADRGRDRADSKSK